MDRMPGYIGHFALSDLIAFFFTNHQLTPAGKENQQFLAVLGAMLATGLSGRQAYLARPHPAGLRLASQKPLVFGIIIQLYDKNSL